MNVEGSPIILVRKLNWCDTSIVRDLKLIKESLREGNVEIGNSTIALVKTYVL